MPILRISLKNTKHNNMTIPNALAMATFPRTAITGTNIMEDPRSQHILMKLTDVPFISVPNGGNFNGGNPDLTFPLKYIHIRKIIINFSTEDNNASNTYRKHIS